MLLRAYVTGNLGDDLFIKIICARYNNVKFYIMGEKKYKSIYEELSNLEYITINQWHKCIRLICETVGLNSFFFWPLPKVDALVYIGGSIFMELKGWRKEFQRNANLFSLFERKYIIGANFGPYYHEEFQELYLNEFKSFDDISFRESSSAALFDSVKNIRVNPDVVFQLDTFPTEGKDYYIISILNCLKKESIEHKHSQYMKKMKEIVSEILKTGSEVVLMSFCEAEGDTIAIEELYDSLQNFEKVKVKKYTHWNIDESLDIIRMSQGIVATRFHAMILGMVWEKKLVPIIYDKKMSNVLEDMEYCGPQYSVEHIEELNAAKLIDELGRTIEIDIENLVAKSKKQFSELDKFLADN